MGKRMTNEEAVLLARAIKAGWPHQKFDIATVDLWAQALRKVDPPLPYADCLEAVDHLVVGESFTGPDDIKATVRRIRARRIEMAGVDRITPNVDPQDVAAYREEILAIAEAVADGRFNATVYQAGQVTLTGAPVRKAITAAPGEVVPHRVNLARVFPKIPPTLDCDYGTSPVVAIPKTVDPVKAAAMEAERKRQLALLEAMMAQDAEPVDGSGADRG